MFYWLLFAATICSPADLIKILKSDTSRLSSVARLFNMDIFVWWSVFFVIIVMVAMNNNENKSNDNSNNNHLIKPDDPKRTRWLH